MKIPSKFPTSFLGAPTICPEGPPWALPQYAARDRWPIVFHFRVPPQIGCFRPTSPTVMQLFLGPYLSIWYWVLVMSTVLWVFQCFHPKWPVDSEIRIASLSGAARSLEPSFCDLNEIRILYDFRSKNPLHFWPFAHFAASPPSVFHNHAQYSSQWVIFSEHFLR